MILLGIQADLNSAVVYMVSTLPLISNFSSLFSKSLCTVSQSPILFGITVTFKSHRFFILFFYTSMYLCSFSLSFTFIFWFSASVPPLYSEGKLFLLWIKTKSGYLGWMRWIFSISNSLSILCFTFSSVLVCCIHQLSALPKFSLITIFTPYKGRAFKRVWVRASFLRYRWLFSVFWPISTILWSGWCRIFLFFPITQDFFPRFWEPFKALQLQVGS